jgi:hypothetical protein
MGVTGATFAGDTGELLNVRVLTVMALFGVVGIGLVALARQLIRQVAWARTTSFFAFLGIAILVALGTALMIQGQEEHGGAYVLMGAGMTEVLCLVGIANLLRRPR